MDMFFAFKKISPWTEQLGSPQTASLNGTYCLSAKAAVAEGAGPDIVSRSMEPNKFGTDDIRIVLAGSYAVDLPKPEMHLSFNNRGQLTKVVGVFTVPMEFLQRALAKNELEARIATDFPWSAFFDEAAREKDILGVDVNKCVGTRSFITWRIGAE